MRDRNVTFPHARPGFTAPQSNLVALPVGAELELAQQFIVVVGNFG